jgi:hypothetical protein
VTLKGNAENGYCRTYIYELFDDYYLPQLALYTRWVSQRVASGDTASPLKPAQELPMQQITEAFYAKPLAQMAPQEGKDPRAAYGKALEKLADAVDWAKTQ